MLKGGVAAIMLILLVYAGSVLVLHYLFVLNRWLGIILSAVLVFYCLAGTTLINEVRQVFLAADHSLEEGRKREKFMERRQKMGPPKGREPMPNP
jgi:adenosylcobinamide-phosphate synthase